MAFPRQPAFQDGVDVLGATTFNDLENRAATRMLPAWAPATPYAVGVQVISSNQAYECLIAHTSGSVFSGAPNWGPVGSLERNQAVAIGLVLG